MQEGLREEYTKLIQGVSERKLKGIYLAGELKGDDELKEFLDLAKKYALSNLKTLNLNNNNLTHKGVRQLLEFLKEKNIQLQKLELGSNKLKGSNNIIKDVLISQKELLVLNLDWNKAEDFDETQNVIAEKKVKLAEAITTPHPLMYLSLINWLEGDADLELLLNNMANYQLQNLKILDLSHNELTWAAVSQLSILQNQGIKLEELNLGSNKLDDTGGATIKELLTSQDEIKTLCLNWSNQENSEESIGTNVVKEIVSTGKQITHLELNGNNLTNADLDELAKILSILKNLAIGYTENFGLLALCNFLGEIENSTIKDLDIDNIPLSIQGKRKVEELRNLHIQISNELKQSDTNSSPDESNLSGNYMDLFSEQENA